jgi:diguanylate cyclase (GGDEF)-like protein
MWWKLLRWLGLVRATLAATLFSILVSVGITSILQAFICGEFGGWGMIMAATVPALIAPLLSYLTFRLLFQLEQTQRELRRLATTDELTNAYNRRYFIELAEQEFARARRYNASFCIAIFDLDDFKLINDQHGHAAGDTVLREISRLCRDQIRQTDVFARYGGEEFVLLLPQADEVQGREVVQRLQSLITQQTIVFECHRLNITASVGLAAFAGGFRDLDALLQAADTALYKAKAAGKKRLVVAASSFAVPVSLTPSA